jgi:hypothetical protein
MLEHYNATTQRTSDTNVVAVVSLERTIQPVSPDLAPLDYHLFRLLKQHSGDRRFHGNEEMEMAVREGVRMQEPHFYCNGNFKLAPTWNEGFSALGHYADK